MSTEAYIASPDEKVEDCWNRIGVWGNARPRCPVLDEVIHCRNCGVYSAAGRHLLDRGAPPEYMEQWGAVISAVEQASAQAAVGVLVFRVGDEWLGLPTKVIREIAEMRPVHRIPHHSGQIVSGLVNVRGQLLIAISLGQLFGICKSERTAFGYATQSYAERLVVIEEKGNHFAFPVSEVYGIHRYHHDDLRDVPATLDHSGASYMKGILKLGDRHVGCVDQEALFEALARCLG